MRKPAIGISAALESSAWGVWRETLANLSPRSYSLSVAGAGAVPVILPADEGTEQDPDAVLDIVDGLVLSGGADIDPASYGAEPHPETNGFRIERDRSEIALAKRALERDMPILCICRGMQLLNVACGGTLDQHLADARLHVENLGEFSTHEVRLEPGSLAARATGGERFEVHSHHHQGIGELGEGLVVTGWADPGDTVEAVEIPDRSFALGVAWHPEERRPSSAFRALADATRLVSA